MATTQNQMFLCFCGICFQYVCDCGGATLPSQRAKFSKIQRQEGLIEQFLIGSPHSGTIRILVLISLTFLSCQESTWPLHKPQFSAGRVLGGDVEGKERAGARLWVPRMLPGFQVRSLNFILNTMLLKGYE